MCTVYCILRFLAFFCFVFLSMALKGFHLYSIARVSGKGKVKTDKKRRALVSKQGSLRLILRALIKNMRLPSLYRAALSLKLASLSANTSATRVVNRCVLTGRGRGVFSKVRLSRHSFRVLAQKGLLPGYKKQN